MTLGQKIKILRESSGMLQRQLAAILEIGDGYLSKVESDQKVLRRAHLKTISKTFNYSYEELEALWIATKIYDIIKNEKEGLNALKVAEEQIKYQTGKNV
ncbi:helix-turn-helix transcriptional regulator [Antarcticibacterium flavum]|uniref:Helix-turn-helix transcriptional regulator n=1 Tax=Antarcticibacterium flavum TaxID=2058175 RepID=A0A5B7X3Y8_9FLAO|nr:MULTISPECIES: helix-turn-helix transcriptional regulator [Antarcticibacterium]MCM4161328.1 XRE family transcriptional regulator [Antarcticibacterium sp. W02-3]QCY69408.1 helix-turn-helix transcriptional regulator [Antarcticibacterium flavum]